MYTVTLAGIALLSLALAAYAHAGIGRFTRGAVRAWSTRLLLVCVALAFGWVVSQGATSEAERLLVFLAGVGLVHVPAAVILFIKQRRGSGRT